MTVLKKVVKYIPVGDNMNTEYMNLPDNKSEVKDENGNVKKSDTKVNDKILMLENKINKVKEEKEKIKIDLKEAKKEVAYAELMLKFRTILFLTTILSGFALGGAFTGGVLFSSSINAFISGFAASALIAGIISTRYISVLKKAKEQVNDLEIKLEEADSIQEKYENELESAKELLNTNEIKETIKPISLKEKNEIELPKIKKEIEEKTEKKIEEKQKKLVLKK